MDGLLAIYAITITFELVLSLVMALILMMIIAPGARANEESARNDEAHPARPLSPSLDVALRDAFRSISRGSDDLHSIVHTRQLLERYQRQLKAEE